MAKYAAISNRFPNFNLADKVQFKDGVFETDSEELWAMLQAHDWWNIHFHPKDAPAETPPAVETASTEAEATTEESSSRARHGQRGSR